MTQVKFEISIHDNDFIELKKIDDDVSKAITKLIRNHAKTPVGHKESRYEIADKPLSEHGGWSIEQFTRLIKQLENAYKSRSDIDSLFALLIAYGNGATNKPTTIQLRERCAHKVTDIHPDGTEETRVMLEFIHPTQWNDFLRTSKARITITAKNMGLKTPFKPAYGQGRKRRHPMLPIFHRYLVDWIAGKIEEANISIDDESHEASIASLRVPQRFKEGV